MSDSEELQDPPPSIMDRLNPQAERAPDKFTCRSQTVDFDSETPALRMAGRSMPVHSTWDEESRKVVFVYLENDTLLEETMRHPRELTRADEDGRYSFKVTFVKDGDVVEEGIGENMGAHTIDGKLTFAFLGNPIFSN